jgi:hypothetical protein
MYRIHKVILIISDALGYLAFCGAAYFVWMFVVSVENQNRHEFGMGFVLFILYGIFPSVLSLGLAVWNKRALPKGLFFVSVAIIPSYVLLYVVYSIG